MAHARPNRWSRVARTVVLVVMMAGLVLATSRADEPTSPAAPAVKKADNPHWRPDGCGYCHEIKGNKPLVAARNVEALCWSCHDGRRAKGESHPVGVAPAEAHITKPGDWPLVDGRLGCMTCHDVKPLHCTKDTFRPAGNAVFLRSQQSGESADAFCRNCHNPQRYARAAPHVMVDAKGEILPNRCLVCHTEVPDRTAKLRTGKPKLRKDITAVCLDCHRPHPDMYARGHVGTALKPAMVEFISKRDIAVLQAQLKKAASQPTTGPDIPLALDAAGKITCATCHNPHQQQTFGGDSVLSYGAMRLVSAVPERVSSGARLQQVCEDCHDMGQLKK